MKATQAWQAALGQLQLEMPKAAFDTWVRDTEFIRFDDVTGIFTVCTRNAYARDWLEDRLTSTVQKLLSGIMNGDVRVKFVVAETAPQPPGGLGFSMDDYQMAIPDERTDDPETAWEIILSTLQKTVRRAEFETWISDTRFRNLGDDGVFVVEQTHSYGRKWLEMHLGGKLDDALSAVLGQSVTVIFAQDHDCPPDGTTPEADAVINVEVIYESFQKVITKPRTAVRVPGYMRRWIPYWGPSLSWMYVGLAQIAFFSRVSTGESFKATLRNIALWSGLGPQTVMRQLNSHQAEWFLRSAEDMHYSMLAYMPFTPGDIELIEEFLSELGVKDNPVNALEKALMVHRRDILPFPVSTPKQMHLEMSPNPRPPVETILDICRPYPASDAVEIKTLAELLVAHLMPVPDELHIPLYFIRSHLKQLRSGPGWLVALLRDESFISRTEGYKNPFFVIGGAKALAQWLGFAVDRGYKNRVTEWLSDSARGKDYLKQFVSHKGGEWYSVVPQDLEILSPDDAHKCAMMTEFVEIFVTHKAGDLLTLLMQDDKIESLVERIHEYPGFPARMEQAARRIEQNPARMEQNPRKSGANGTKSGANGTKPGANGTILTLFKYLKTTFKYYGITTPQIQAFLADAKQHQNDKIAIMGGGEISSWGLGDLLRKSGIKSTKMRNQIRETISAVEFVAATLYAVAQSDDSVSGLLASVLTNPDGVQLDQSYRDLANLHPGKLAKLIQEAYEFGGITENPVWNGAMQSIKQSQLEDLAERLLLTQNS
ncbi:MAG: hypothetical protein HN413_01060 [Chloroflexi bacterium]|nr:hypothetical protein [Chloroflexota bacterium]